MALAQVLSCKFYEISTNNFFTEHLLVTASWKIIPYKQIRISLKVDQFDKIWRSDTFLPWELFNNYVILKLSFFNPPILTITVHHEWSQDPLTLRHVWHRYSPLPLSIISLFSSWKKPKDTHPLMTHPSMFLSN